MQNTKKGFIAIITAVVLSSALMLIALADSGNMSTVFDMVMRKEYRVEASKSAQTCLDHLYVELAHDYFYTVPPQGIYYADDICSISSVTVGDLPLTRDVVVDGFAPDQRRFIKASIHARISLGDTSISLINATTSF